jgi:galactokinase
MVPLRFDHPIAFQSRMYSPNTKSRSVISVLLNHIQNVLNNKWHNIIQCIVLWFKDHQYNVERLPTQQEYNPGYNDNALCDTSFIALDIRLCQLISHC